MLTHEAPLGSPSHVKHACRTDVRADHCSVVHTWGSAAGLAVRVKEREHRGRDSRVGAGQRREQHLPRPLMWGGQFPILKTLFLCSQPSGTAPLSVTAALQLTHSQEDSSRCSDNSSYEEPLSPISASSSTSRRRQGQRDLELPDMHMRDLVGMGHHFLPSEPTKWNVEDVYEFIRSLPGKFRGNSSRVGIA